MDISRFEKTNAQLEGLFNEIGTLSKKKPDDAINKFKLKFINQIILESNDILGDLNLPFADFRGFEEEDMPSNSDVVIILSQYLNCLEKLRADNITPYGGGWYWLLNGNRTETRTAPPKKIFHK
ncbi:hypothetical protein JOD43_004255 [Pullulanibacillus pueri]|uniref:Uncharacterized protein n=1 Tax=Pullulanibacillus pueri TaxID=1437324 RepID=A0A8J3EPK3_9BACL|nr:hypothetical protein [Pullulanibacillus pueri]MBM7684058.1 hypothetical protein [Pullulanibacillus pueri]GGH88583.1 hypothetical protein GCM10007096_41250 [Pullulanibacillus pueri]